MRCHRWIACIATIVFVCLGDRRSSAQTTSVDRWVTFRHDYQRSGRTTVVGPQALDAIKWKTPVASDVAPYGDVQTSPAIGLSGQVIVSAVRDVDNQISTYLASIGPDGSVLWRREISSGQSYSSPSLATDDTIYIGTDSSIVSGKSQNTIRSFDSLGNDRWSSSFPSITNPIYATPTLSADQHTLYIGAHSLTGLFYAVAFDTGVLVWPSPEVTGSINSSAALGKDGTLYFGSQGSGGRLTAVSPDNGEAKWIFETDGLEDVTPALSDNGVLYVGTSFGVMYAVDAATGNQLWSDSTAQNEYLSSPAIASDGTVYAGNYDGFLYAFNGATGVIKWKFNAGDIIYSSPAVGGDGTIYFGCYNGYVYALNADGSLKSKYFMRDDSGNAVQINSSPVIGPDGTLYIGGGDGYLYAFRGKATLPGDINQNGRVDVGDASLALRSVIGAVKLTSDQIKIGDVSPKNSDGTHGDGKIRIDDVVRILRRSVGLEPDPWP